MSIAIKQLGLVSAISDLPAGGAIALGVGLRIEQHRALTVNQTTAAQTLTLPAPVDATVIFGLQVSNIGSVDFTMHGVTLSPASSATYYWNGSAWSPDAAPQAGGVVVETLTPTAQNVVPSLATARRSGTPVLVFVNGSFVSAGIAVSVPGVVTVDPVALGYNVEVTDRVSVSYHI